MLKLSSCKLNTARAFVRLAALLKERKYLLSNLNTHKTANTRAPLQVYRYRRLTIYQIYNISMW